MSRFGSFNNAFVKSRTGLALFAKGLPYSSVMQVSNGLSDVLFSALVGK